MTASNFIAYYRVSTQQQGASGLGLEAQREAVLRYLNGRAGQLLGEFVEVETGKGSKPLDKRPQLREALLKAKRTGATLVIAKLDRLARDVRFFLEALDDYGVNLKFLDFSDIDPKTDEGRMVLISMANFAEFEGRRIGTRTKAALSAAKARGVKLGRAGPENLRPNIEARQTAADAFAIKLAPVVKGLQAQGLSQRGMATALTDLGVKTPAGKTVWAQRQVALLLGRIAETNAEVV